MIPAKHSPEQIMAKIFGVTAHTLHQSTDYDLIVKHLNSYRKKAVGWDEYARVIDDDLRETMAKVISECRRQGYIGMHVKNNRIRFYFVADNRPPNQFNVQHDLCTLCERECNGKDFNGVMRKGMKRCWE